MPRFLLLRHAESGTPGVYYGRSDVPVTPRGREQEERALALAAGQSFAAVVTSPLQRCRNLAARLAEASGAPLATDPDLVEIHLGDWEGRGFDEASNIYAEISRQLLAYDPALAFPGGESLREFRRRAGEAWTALAARHADAAQPVLVVCHAGVIRAIVAGLRDQDTAGFWQHRIPNCSATLLETRGAATRILGVGEELAAALARQ
jgi:broad specificity phosphatase PhoE